MAINLYVRAKYARPVKIRHCNKAKFSWSISFSYFQLDSYNDRFAAAVSKSAVAVTVLARVSSSFGLGFASGVVIVVQVPVVAPIATHFRFCSYPPRSFEAAR